MKLAITGKGGVGKTTITALLAHAWSKQRSLTVVDGDPSMNLGQALGIPPEEINKIIPLSEMKELIEERTSTGIPSVFNLNPKVDDLAEKVGVMLDQIRLIVMGTILVGGGGCACGTNTLLRAFLSHLVLKSEEVVLVDMEAGIEHLGRRTIQGVDGIIVLMEPGQRSIAVVKRIVAMAEQIGIKKVFYLLNRADSPALQEQIAKQLPAGHFLGHIPPMPELVAADFQGKSVGEVLQESPALAENINAMIKQLTAAV